MSTLYSNFFHIVLPARSLVSRPGYLSSLALLVPIVRSICPCLVRDGPHFLRPINQFEAAVISY